MKRKSAILDLLKGSNNILASQFNIETIGLFGSFASEKNTVDRDIDLIFKLSEGKKLGFKEMFLFENFMKELLDSDNIDLVNSSFVNPIIE